MTQKLWHGRFSEQTDKIVEVFTSSIAFDKRFYKYDIQGSAAHCKMLAKANIISQDEANLIIKGLEDIEKEIENGQFKFSDALEDIHMHIEHRLAQKIGDTAKKLHTARSRNDQIALDMRMFLRDAVTEILYSLIQIRRVLLDLAKQHIKVIFPGYTHLQRAQPVLFSHHLMAYFEMFSRDAERFSNCLKRTNVMPLGAAALAGTTYPIDREYTAKLLNFPEVSENSMDSVADRDFAVEFLSCSSITMIHLSRMSEEFILWSSVEFSFIELPDSFATGSSIMPQKKNPDVAELVRGKTGRVFGSLNSLLCLMKSLPLTYNRDMQEDKEPVFDCADTLKGCLAVYIQMLPKLKIKEQKMLKAASEGFLNATDLADYLAERSMPFRQAHERAGKAVAYALKQNKELHQLTLQELKSFSSLFENDIFQALELKNIIDRRKCYGATAEENVINAVKSAQKKLDKETNKIKAQL